MKALQLLISFLFGAALVIICSALIGIWLIAQAGFDNTLAPLSLLVLAFALSMGLCTAGCTYIDLNRISSWKIRVLFLAVVPSIGFCIMLIIYILLQSGGQEFQSLLSSIPYILYFLIPAFFIPIAALATPVGFFVSNKIRKINQKKFQDTYEKYTDTRDGYQYNTIKIGEMIFLAENLSYKPDNGNYWFIENKSKGITTYLYDWNTAKNSCPLGWHIPTKKEWEILTKIYSESGIFYNLIEGGSSGFNALAHEDEDVFWCEDSGGEGKAWTFKIYDNTFWVGTKINLKKCNEGFKIRLIKDV